MSQLTRPEVSRDATGDDPAGAARLPLNPGPTGTAICPGDPDWDTARAAWIANADQRPAAVAVVRSVQDVCAVVVDASRKGLTVIAQGTGHGAAPVGSLAGTVLIRTSALARVEIDTAARTARFGAGAEWSAVTAAAGKHGLAAQAGSADNVGVAGYLLSGGLSWLARLRGLAVNDVVRLEVVTADGDRHIVDSEHEPDLFWALRGGGGSFGIVTGIELRLHPLPSLNAGILFYPISRAGEVLHAWCHWTRNLSDRTTSCGRLLQFPPMPELPPQLSGQAFVVVEVAHQGSATELDTSLSSLRALGPSMDTITEIPAAALGTLHMDPPGPIPCRGNGMVLTDLPATAIDALVTAAGRGSGSPLASVELRHLGGALARRPPHAGAVGHLDGSFLMYAAGFTPGPASEAKVDAHIETVERALHPWAADVHYANLDERPSGGRARFHDQATLERLRAIKQRVDPDALFTGSHPLTATS